MITKSYSTNNRAPKLRSLKNQAVFSETIGSVGIVDADLSPQVRPKVWLIYKYFFGFFIIEPVQISMKGRIGTKFLSKL